MEVVWAAPPTGAPLARQGRFASLRDGLRPPWTREPLRALMAGERAGHRPARRIRAAQTEGLERARIRPTETSVDPNLAMGFHVAADLASAAIDYCPFDTRLATSRRWSAHYRDRARVIGCCSGLAS